MATNDILPFCATDTGTNLLTEGEYAVDAQRPIGNQPGVARSKLVNKALRQATYMASCLAQYLVNVTGNNVLDDATPSSVLTTMALAFNPTPVAARVDNASGAISTAGVLAPVTFTNITYDTNSGFNTPNPNVYTVPAGKGGQYQIDINLFTSVYIVGSGGDTMYAALYKNGSLYQNYIQAVSASNVGGSWGISCSDTINCAAGDTLQVYFGISSTNSVTFFGQYCSLSIFKV